MNAKDKPVTFESLLEAVDGEVLSHHVSDVEIADELRAAGGDPEAIGARGKTLAQLLLSERNVRQRVGRAALRSPRSVMSPRRQLLLSEIDTGRANRRFAEFLEDRGFDPETATEDELWEVLRRLREMKEIPPSD